MAKFPDDAADFAKDLERLGIRYEPVDTIAGTIGYSTSHVSNLLGGGKRYAPGARTKIGEMITKANGLGDLPGPSIAEEYRVDPMPSAPAQGKHRWMGRYMVIHMSLGEYALVEILAPFRDAGTANLICDLLNKEAG